MIKCAIFACKNLRKYGTILKISDFSVKGMEITMILSDKTIREYLSCGRLSIDPMEPGQIQPASVDIRIGDTYSIVEDSCDGVIHLGSEIRYKTIQSDRYLLMPGQFVLATTMEYFRLGDDLTAFVEGRSSIGRLGLFIQNAGWVDPGFEGEITLELYNASRCAIELEAGRPGRSASICPAGQACGKPISGKISRTARCYRLAYLPG